MTIIPNSYGVLREFNTCHSSEDGKFCGKAGSTAADALTRQMKPLTSLLGLPRAQFVAPDGRIYRGRVGTTHEGELKAIGSTIRQSLRAGLIRVVVTNGGKIVAGFSVGAPVTAAQADLLVPYAEGELHVDVLVAAGEHETDGTTAPYVSQRFTGSRLNSDGVRRWVNQQFQKRAA